MTPAFSTVCSTGGEATGQGAGDPGGGLAGVHAEQDAGGFGPGLEGDGEGESDYVDRGLIEGRDAGYATNSICAKELLHPSVISSAMIAGKTYSGGVVWLIDDSCPEVSDREPRADEGATFDLVGVAE